MGPYNKMFEFTNENRYFCIIYEEKSTYIRSGDEAVRNGRISRRKLEPREGPA